MNIADGTFLSNFLDFGQFSVDSREVDIENNQKRLMFFLVLLSTFDVQIRHVVALTRHFALTFS